MTWILAWMTVYGITELPCCFCLLVFVWFIALRAFSVLLGRYNTGRQRGHSMCLWPSEHIPPCLLLFPVQLYAFIRPSSDIFRVPKLSPREYTAHLSLHSLILYYIGHLYAFLIPLCIMSLSFLGIANRWYLAQLGWFDWEAFGTTLCLLTAKWRSLSFCWAFICFWSRVRHMSSLSKLWEQSESMFPPLSFYIIYSQSNLTWLNYKVIFLWGMLHLLFNWL